MIPFCPSNIANCSMSQTKQLQVFTHPVVVLTDFLFLKKKFQINTECGWRGDTYYKVIIICKKSKPCVPLWLEKVKCHNVKSRYPLLPIRMGGQVNESSGSMRFSQELCEFCSLIIKWCFINFLKIATEIL